MNDPLAFCAETIERLRADSLHRSVRALSSSQGPHVETPDGPMLLLASNNYLGLATDARVVEAGAEATRRWGTGAGSARLISGGVTVHDELEERLASLKRAESALLFSSGYLANLGVIATLVEAGDVVVSDELNHASIVDGARMSRASVRVYEHANVDHLRTLLRESAGARRILVVTDTVFSMDGDLAPLPQIVEECARAGAILMVDEAHATGVVGPGGRGGVAHFGVEDGVHVVVGTLSKALGAAGGFVAGSRALVDLLRNRARTFIFDTAMPAPVAAAALAALGVLESEPSRPERARSLARELAVGVRAAGFDVRDPVAAIVPVMVGESDAALALAEALRREGVLVPAIRPPSVRAGTARLRATVMATHSDEDIARGVRAFAAARAGVLS
jgi:8-amino-7-oxononanoate synthase